MKNRRNKNKGRFNTWYLALFRPYRQVLKKEPRLLVGGPNQKPLTIKPYPMKIH